jgi:hypothetical protein
MSSRPRKQAHQANPEDDSVEMLPTRDPDPDQAWKALALVNDWVKHAEAKSVATLAAAGVTGGVLYNLVRNQSHPSIWLSIVAVACGAATVASALASLAALAPQLTIPVRRRWRRSDAQPTAAAANQASSEQEAEAAQAAGEHDPTNLLFFGDIARKYQGDAPSYADVLAALITDHRGLIEHIARQIHANSLVAHRKYTLANRAIQALRVALVFLALTAIIVGKP